MLRLLVYRPHRRQSVEPNRRDRRRHCPSLSSADSKSQKKNKTGCDFSSADCESSGMSQDEFNSLLKRHAGLIYRVALTYCRNPTDREDVIQEIAVQLWKSLDHYDKRFRESTWIYRIAINVAISFHRRERRHSQQRTSIDGSGEAIAATPIEPNQDLELLMRHVEELADMDRALILL